MFRKKALPPGPPEWLIVGLGNPGPEYSGTRHNVGFAVVDHLCEKHRLKLTASKHRARYVAAMVEGHSIVVAKPLTFMNLSGQAIAPLAKEFGILPDRILVIADEMDLPVGRVRMRPKGRSGRSQWSPFGHRLASDGGVPRLRIGIGKGDSETLSHVLGSFAPEERVSIQEAIEHCVRTIEVLLTDGLERAMEGANRN